MKHKFVLALFVVALSLLMFVGCSSNNQDNTTETVETNASRHELTDEQKKLNTVTKYQKTVYSDDNVEITLREINTAQGFVFDIKNKTKSTTFSVITLCAAVDGWKAQVNKDNYGPDEHPNDLMNLEAGKTDMLVYYRGFEHTEHKTLSAAFQIELDDGTVLETVDIVDYDLGKTANAEDSIGIKADYESDNLTFWYGGWVNDGLLFYVENKLDTMASFSFYQKDNPDSYFMLNGEQITEYNPYSCIVVDGEQVPEYRYIETVRYLPAHSISCIWLDDSDVSRYHVGSIAFKGMLFKGNQTKTPIETFDFAHEVKY